MCEYDIPCALEKIVIADLSALITWSFKIISSPPAQCLRPRELLRWGLTWAHPAHKVISPFDHVILPNHVANLNHYNSSIAVSTATKLSWMVTFVGVLLQSHMSL